MLQVFYSSSVLPPGMLWHNLVLHQRSETLFWDLRRRKISKEGSLEYVRSGGGANHKTGALPYLEGPTSAFESVAQLALRHPHANFTLHVCACVYIGSRRRRGEGWRDKRRETSESSLFHGWLRCYGNKTGLPIPQKLPPSSLLPFSPTRLIPLFLTHPLSSPLLHP